MVTGAARCYPECGASGPAVKGAPRRLRRFRSAPPLTPTPPPRADVDPDGQGWGRRIRVGGPRPFIAGCGPVQRKRPSPSGVRHRRSGHPLPSPGAARPNASGGHRTRRVIGSRCRVRTGPSWAGATVGLPTGHSGRPLRHLLSESCEWTRRAPPRQTECAPSGGVRPPLPAPTFEKLRTDPPRAPLPRPARRPAHHSSGVPDTAIGHARGRTRSAEGARGRRIRNFPEVGAGRGRRYSIAGAHAAY